MSFNPDWKDDVVYIESMDIPLILPPDTVKGRDKEIWVESRYVLRERLFEQTYQYDTPVKRTYILRKSEAGKKYIMTDSEGNPLDQNQQQAMYHLIFPPRVWMSDSLQERSMTYAAAKTAVGDILVGGLGLAVYPQFVLYLKRVARRNDEAITSITIVESSREIIDIVGQKWFAENENQPRITIVEDTIEHHLQQEGNFYDIIYLDVWGDIHFKILPYINHLIAISEPRLKENGHIQCWGYNAMMRLFIQFAELLEKKDMDNFIINLPEDLLLHEYLKWRKPKQKPSLSEIRQKARELATTIRADSGIPLSIDLSRSKWL